MIIPTYGPAARRRGTFAIPSRGPSVDELMGAPVAPAVPRAPRISPVSAAPPTLMEAQQGYNLLPTDVKRRTTSPMFYDSVRRNNQTNAARSQMNAAMGAIGPAAAPPTTQRGVPEPATLPVTLGQVPTQPGPDVARARIVTGSPAQPASRITPGQHMQNEMQRESFVGMQQNRGLGLPVQDGGAYQYQPMPQGTPATPDTQVVHTRDFARPLPMQYSPEQQAARNQARQTFKAEAADIASGGANTARDLARQTVDQQGQALQAEIGLQKQKADALTTGAQANVTRAEAAKTSATAAVKASEARMVEAQRPRQATPGTKPEKQYEPTLADYTKIYEAATGGDTPNEDLARWAQLQIGGLQQRLDQRRAGATTQPAAPTTQPAAPQATVEDHVNPETGERYRLVNGQWVAVPN